MRTLLAAILTLIPAFAIRTLSASDELAKPNIVLFFVDDFGARDLSCYGSGLYETPNMDRLAAEGMRFTDAYSAYPRCVPSRVGLLSGKYPARVQFESDQRKGKEHHLPLSEVSFGEALKEYGYETCYIGKWHLGHEGGDPGAQGFDTVIHSGSAGATGSFFHPFSVEKGHSVENPIASQEGDYLVDRMTDEAVKYIDSAKAKPFLMVMAHYAVHTPIEAPEDITKKYSKKLRKAGVEIGGKNNDADFVRDRQGITKTLQNNPTYAAMIEKTDDSLGRIMRALESAGVANNTVVILTSDHGGLSTRGLGNKRAVATSNAPFRQGKGSIFEGGTRVPLIVKWPNKIEPGTNSSVQVTGTDHYPTMLEITGAPLRPEQHVDGRSYLKALQGETYQRDAMFWYKWQARPDSTGDTRALSLVDGNFKLVQWIDEDLTELFDLSKDISERTNLADQMPERAESMLQELLEMEQTVGNLREKGRLELERRLERTKQRPSAKP
ncbi:sulfatase [Neorhodopirellula pilleata]|uniref:Arylsulfatase n=1 Tax=Neorhodopirellula pilleata TaxID=2714738 RepID=A0A5C6AYX2_9BACT|nr:sulfatase [Neorhodopirellula pilleata]TWU03344.1 Arylsulfatase [Neorhodopirellula pilleata]